MMASAFTLTWAGSSSYCEAMAVIPLALDAIDVDLGVDEDDEPALEDLRAAVDSCPQDDLAVAMEHLRRAGGASDLAYDLVQEALSNLESHGTFCQCADNAWREYLEEVDRLLADFEGNRFRVDDVTSAAPVPLADLADYPGTDVVLNLLSRAGISNPGQLTFEVDTAGVLTVSGKVPQRTFAVELTPLGADDEALAAALSGDPHAPEDARFSPAHHLAGYAEPVRQVSAALVRQNCEGGVAAERAGVAALLRTVARAHCRLSSEQWLFVTRYAPTWGGTWEELELTVAAVAETVPA